MPSRRPVQLPINLFGEQLRDPVGVPDGEPGQELGHNTPGSGLGAGELPVPWIRPSGPRTASTSAAQFRTYRISRILDASVLPEIFVRHPDFNLAGYWRDYLEHFDQRRHQNHATLQPSPEGFERLPHLMEPSVVEAAKQSAAPTGSQGWIQVTIPIESTDSAIVDLLRLGPEAEVLEPNYLRTQLLHTLDALNRLYDRGSVKNVPARNI